jgi:phenylalanyl-tRNA synthetase alpha subunit
VRTERGWVELGECGLAHPEVLAASGLRGYSGLAKATTVT